MKINLRNLNLQELEEFVINIGEKKFRAKQIFKWLQRGITDFNEMTDISKETQKKINEKAIVENLLLEKKIVSKLDETQKYIFRTRDNNLIESVFMKYKHGFSVCVSTQIGCRMNCKFCASSKNKWIRNLDVSEMINQILSIVKNNGKTDRISNIVLMGIGEPLDNYDNVLKFLKLINHPDGLAISHRNVSLSTSGLVPKINKLMEENLKITLSVSLHAPTNKKRNDIMPINKKYDIESLLETCKKYADTTKRRISFEYLLIRKFNDTVLDAKILAKSLRNIMCHVNLINVNPIKETKFEKSDPKDAAKFMEILNEHGIPVTIRRSMGKDIEAACGQLRNNYQGAENEINQ